MFSSDYTYIFTFRETTIPPSPKGEGILVVMRMKYRINPFVSIIAGFPDSPIHQSDHSEGEKAYNNMYLKEIGMKVRLDKSFDVKNSNEYTKDIGMIWNSIRSNFDYDGVIFGLMRGFSQGRTR